ncbi:6666_t:CDS:2, partial [Racocetra fulgida]
MSSSIDKPAVDYDVNKVTGGASEPLKILAVSPNNTHSDLAIAISNITTVSRIGLDLASFMSQFALGTAKISTSLGLDIARTMTGVVSDRIVQATNGNGGIIDASTTLLHRTLSLTEQIALSGLEFTSETVQLALGTATESMSLIDTLFGTTDAAKALAEFVQLVKREWDYLYETDDKLTEPDDFGAFKVVKALTAWACLQYVTSEIFERNTGGWKKVKLIGLWDICNDWVHVSHDDDFSVYDELESLCIQEEADDEMVIVGQSKPSKSNNIVVGDLTPRDELPDFKFTLNDEYTTNATKRLSDLFMETTKRYSNPYLQEFETQTKKEKLFSLLHNLKRYSKFSSSAYDFKNAIFGTIPLPVPRSKEKGRYHRFNFARSAELSSDSIVDSSFHKCSKNGSYQPTYYLIRDHTTRSIILALRGTMSVHDLIVDLTCEYEDFQLPEDIQ